MLGPAGAHGCRRRARWRRPPSAGGDRRALLGALVLAMAGAGRTCGCACCAASCSRRLALPCAGWCGVALAALMLGAALLACWPVVGCCAAGRAARPRPARRRRHALYRHRRRRPALAARRSGGRPGRRAVPAAGGLGQRYRRLRWPGAGSADRGWRRAFRPARPGPARSAACSRRSLVGWLVAAALAAGADAAGAAVAVAAGCSASWPRPAICRKLRQAPVRREGFRPADPRPWRVARRLDALLAAAPCRGPAGAWLGRGVVLWQ